MLAWFLSTAPSACIVRRCLAWSLWPLAVVAMLFLASIRSGQYDAPTLPPCPSDMRVTSYNCQPPSPLTKDDKS